jgi:hypothetical protein
VELRPFFFSRGGQEPECVSMSACLRTSWVLNGADVCFSDAVDVSESNFRSPQLLHLRVALHGVGDERAHCFTDLFVMGWEFGSNAVHCFSAFLSPLLVSSSVETTPVRVLERS